MDRITGGFLKEFCISHGLEKQEESTQFEHFANYCALSNEAGVVEIDIQDMSTGDSAQGIDGIAIEVNGSIVDSVDEISVLIKQNKRLDVKFVFVQAKTSDKFENADISNFLTFVCVFFSSEANRTFVSEEMAKFLELKEFIYSNSQFMKAQNPSVRLYYIAPGIWDENDASLKAAIDPHLQMLETMALFSSVKFIPCGAREVQKMYRKSQEQIEATFVFNDKVMMFSDENGDYGYIGALPFSEYFNIICESNGSLKNVFEDNIRDFLGEDNYVNASIEQTIIDGRRSAFCMLNNGVTVVAHSAIVVRDKMTITGYQIVNGCQTSHVLYLNRNAEKVNDILIPIKIIVTEDEDLKNRITKATNNQTSITKEQLEALSTFQKTLEEYYRTYSTADQRLYYERRTGQYSSESVPNSRIVSIRAQLKNFSSMFNDKPHDAAGHYSSLLKDIGIKVFAENDRLAMYYTSSLALLRFEMLVKSKLIPRELRKGKYHVIMLLKYAIAKTIPKYNNAKKMDSVCSQILGTLNDPDLCLEFFTKVVDFIRSQAEIDLNERKVFEKKETTDLLLSRIKSLQ